MSTWKYSQNGQSCGPVEASELQALLNKATLPPDTLVWKEGMPNWVPASTLPEFAPQKPAGLAATPPAPGTFASAKSSEPALPAGNSDAADIEKNKVFAVLAYLGILFLVPLLAGATVEIRPLSYQSRHCVMSGFHFGDHRRDDCHIHHLVDPVRRMHWSSCGSRFNDRHTAGQ